MPSFQLTRVGLPVITAMALLVAAGAVSSAERRDRGWNYPNQLERLVEPDPILADFPDFVEPIRELQRFEAPALVMDPGADLEVRAWRFSYNARGIIEFENKINASETALVVVHPWGVDDGQGWRSPEPAGVALFCTPEKNRIYHRHIEQVVNPFLKRLRGNVRLVAYSLPGDEDPIRRKLYRSIHSRPSEIDRAGGARLLSEKLANFDYTGQPLDDLLKLDQRLPVVDYFRQFSGLDSGAKFNHAGFWDLPTPVAAGIDVDAEDVVIYDQQGYPAFRDFLRSQRIRHVLLAGYATDMCLCSTTAGYENLSPDFNVFIVGDATLATFPAADTPRFATTTALCNASLDHLITQVSWVTMRSRARAGE